MKRLEEYLSNNTSDFSDGTNGEPSAPGRTSTDTGTTVGMPDYKYVERKRSRHEKLLALRKRRDPDGIEKPLDYGPIMKKILARESLDDDFDTKDLEAYTQLEKGHGMSDYFHVNVEGKFIGSIYRDTATSKTTPTLAALRKEFPWVTMPSHSGPAGRHKTKEEAAAYLRDRFDGKKREGYSPEYWRRFDELRRGQPAAESIVQSDVDAILQAVLEDRP